MGIEVTFIIHNLHVHAKSNWETPKGSVTFLVYKNDNGLIDGWTDKQSDHFMTSTSLCRALKN